MPTENFEPVDDFFYRAVRPLLQARQDMLPGNPPDATELWALADSRHRLAEIGLDPDHGAGTPTLSPSELEKRRYESQLADLIPVLRRAYQGGDHSQVMTVHDFTGHILWRFGSDEALKYADSLGLVEGACWAENVVGTNAAGTALFEGRGLRCIASEHYMISHRSFACAATPLYDTWDQRLIGILNATTPKKNAHPNTLPMVELLARHVEEQARQAHEAEFTPLRKAAWPALLRLGTPAVVTDQCGHVVEFHRIARKPAVLPLPAPGHDQPFECPQLGGWWVIEPLGSGWLWRPSGVDPMPATKVELDVREPKKCSLTVHWSSTSIWYDLTSKKDAEVLFLLAWMRIVQHTKKLEERRARKLGEDLYDGHTAEGTVRCLFSRMRQKFGYELFHSDPYRFREHIEVTLHMPDNVTDLLPFSTAPTIRRIRAGSDIDGNR